MNDAKRLPCLITENKRLAMALRKERALDKKLAELLRKGLRADALILLETHLRKVGELNHG
uniref:hypothetical protein n=1 Tax=Marinobacterium profundum TaxID=1714300 RepID=UPI000830286A|nr:hypothetical protein [Marinobacterium profundum]